MGSELEALRASFLTNTYWAEWAASAVFIGLIVDIAVILIFDLRDKTKSRWEIILAGIGAAVIATGVFGESHFGHRATDASSRIQADLEKEAADARLAQEVLHSDNLKLQSKLKNVDKDVAREKVREKQADLHIAELQQETALARQQIAEANSRAASANEKTEAERLARVKLEKAVAWRELSDTQILDIAAKMRPFAGEKLDVFAYRDEPDAWMLASRIMSAVGGSWTLPVSEKGDGHLVMRRKHWWSEWEFDPKASGGWTLSPGAGWKVKAFWVVEHDRMGSGIDIETSKSANDRDLAAAKALVLALKAENLEVDGPYSTESERHRDVELLNGTGNPTAPIELTILFRPPPNLNDRQ